MSWTLLRMISDNLLDIKNASSGIVKENMSPEWDAISIPNIYSGLSSTKISIPSTRNLLINDPFLLFSSGMIFYLSFSFR